MLIVVTTFNTLHTLHTLRKVTIAMLNFEPQLLYFETPALEPAFYLQVRPAP